MLILLSGINVYAQNTYVFFGSFNRDKNTEGIYVYELDIIKGNLSKVTSVKGILNPSFLTLAPNGQYLFACTESKTKDAGSVSSFKFNPEKKSLTFINSQRTGGENPVYITAHKNGKWLINGNYTEGSVSVYPVSENGLIEPRVQNFQYSEGSTDPDRQERSHIHSTVFSPDFNYVFAPDLGADKIRAYQFENNKTEPLTEIPFKQAPLGSGPRHFTFHPNGKFAYCVEEMGGAVSAYSYDSGKLESIQRINTHPDQLKDNFENSDIHISPDGRYLYASNRGSENNIAIFSIQNDGTLKTIGYQKTGGKHPRVFTLDETGKFLIATNSVSGDAFVFKRNEETGLLKKVGKKIKIFGVSSVQIRKY
ncbi:6-phosphogluconolactonase [Chryseobacterium lactis]|uniref:6-phosphogluconolactonase n=2 Tax=Chryseobacterium lactis TaxID=1241981 RepID=A0A3G6RHK2_CHRLC|nr:lactonase family protein [Chryseobacterium lactis]AZA84136.1 lactonase family protein [Chryseobacterium lactis]AZB04522.1 lactonase family protein [Chryseobacterium lactis]PNW12691.1 6-phosphogluconolactonase [Chryseobacterium lactis]